ncbi:unnamed protein product [Triticum turgidum subsp. durum]|uniref:Uncharacterized protein n=1 Tax=Triticum turgidum subsp. durum TaxID=4567 RepID=A0A9R0QFZ9_TRITD|nr:unnamed protein product [Triticum turgidum subsp. durum]
MTTVVALLVVVVVACQLPCVTGGGVTTVQAFDGTTTLGLQGQCAADEQELVGRKPSARYISYAALRADATPCDKRGQSYYTNCGSMQQANPYTRGCSAITRCARNMN